MKTLSGKTNDKYIVIKWRTFYRMIKLLFLFAQKIKMVQKKPLEYVCLEHHKASVSRLTTMINDLRKNTATHQGHEEKH